MKRCGQDKDGNEITFLDVVESDDRSVEDEIDLKIKIKKLYKKISEILLDREKLIIELRFGLNGKESKTQNEIAKESTNKTEEKKPTDFGLEREEPLKMFSLKTPMKLRPKKITARPVTISTIRLYLRSSIPRLPESAPSKTKTVVKPRTKPSAFFTVLATSLSSPPAK